MVLNKLAHLIRLSVLLALIAAAAGCGTPPAAPGNATIQLTPCQLAASDLPARREAQCGALRVYEDYAAQSGRQIGLHIAVIPAVSRTPAPDPFVFITGGPGGASTRDYLSVWPAFQRINEKRDIVLMDQRGTGQSHPLECPAANGEQEAGEDEAAIQAWSEACLKQLDADPRFYTTSAAVEDLDQVRAALGYDRLNLYGVSYGTRVVQTYLRRYPQHVRTVILDGVVPQDEPLGVTLASDAQRALDLIWARCAADRDCNAAFPDLPGAVTALLERLETPVRVTVPHPTTAQPTTITFTRARLATVIRMLSYSKETTALLPLLLHTARTTGDWGPLAAQSLLITQQLQNNLNTAVHNSVVCAEDVPFYNQAGRFIGDAELEQHTYLGQAYRQLEQICAHWPAAPVPPAFKELVVSDTPALLLSGEADPVTPPSNAEHVASGFSHSLSLVAPGQGHSVILRGCIPQITTQFIERGTVEGLQTGCVGKIQAMPFFTSYTGPQP